jgi:hypothetical protein
MTIQSEMLYFRILNFILALLYELKFFFKGAEPIKYVSAYYETHRLLFGRKRISRYLW